MKSYHHEESQWHSDNPSASSSNKKQRTLDSSFSTKEQKERAVSKFEESVFEYINDSGTSKNNIETDRFKKMFKKVYTISQEEAPLLLFVLVNTSLKSCRNNLSSAWSPVSQSMVKSIRTWYKNKAGCLHKLISVCQDIWDNQRCEHHGISLIFIHPETCEHFKVSAGLVHITSKKATNIAHDTLSVLNRYGVMQQDLFRHVNDTTVSTLLAGRLIVG